MARRLVLQLWGESRATESENPRARAPSPTFSCFSSRRCCMDGRAARLKTEKTAVRTVCRNYLPPRSYALHRLLHGSEN